MDRIDSGESAQPPFLQADVAQGIHQAVDNYWHQQYLQLERAMVAAGVQIPGTMQQHQQRVETVRGRQTGEAEQREREQRLLQQPPSTSVKQEQKETEPEADPFIDPQTVAARQIGEAAAQEYGRQTEDLARKRHIAQVTTMHHAKRKKVIQQLDESIRKLTPLPHSIITPEQEDPFYIEHCLDLNVDPNNQEMMNVYRRHWYSEIRTRHLHGLDKKTNYKCILRVDNPRLTICQLLTQICNAEPTAFRINVEYAAILQNLETNELKFFFNAENTRVFHSNMLVRGQADMDKLILAVERHDFGLYAAKMRPNTKWVPRSQIAYSNH